MCCFSLWTHMLFERVMQRALLAWYLPSPLILILILSFLLYSLSRPWEDRFYRELPLDSLLLHILSNCESCICSCLLPAKASLMMTEYSTNLSVQQNMLLLISNRNHSIDFFLDQLCLLLLLHLPHHYPSSAHNIDSLLPVKKKLFFSFTVIWLINIIASVIIKCLNATNRYFDFKEKFQSETKINE